MPKSRLVVVANVGMVWALAVGRGCGGTRDVPGARHQRATAQTCAHHRRPRHVKISRFEAAARRLLLFPTEIMRKPSLRDEDKIAWTYPCDALATRCAPKRSGPYFPGCFWRMPMAARKSSSATVVSDEAILGGVPVVKGTRIPADT